MDIPTNIEAEIKGKVSSGLYKSPEEVLDNAMQALESFEMKQKVDLGIEQLDRGESEAYDEAGLSKLKARIRKRGMECLENHPETA